MRSVPVTPVNRSQPPAGRVTAARADAPTQFDLDRSTTHVNQAKKIKQRRRSIPLTSVLMVLSAADHWTLADGTLHPTGFWAEEFVEPHRIFSAAGWDITIATPAGVAPTVDKVSLGLIGGLPAKTRSLADYLDDHAEILSHPKALTDV